MAILYEPAENLITVHLFILVFARIIIIFYTRCCLHLPIFNMTRLLVYMVDHRSHRVP